MRSYRMTMSIDLRNRGARTACIARCDDGHAYLASGSADPAVNIAEAKQGLASLSRMAARGKTMRAAR